MSRAHLVASCAFVLLTGCAAIATPDGERLRLTSVEFRAYVERVFREQNRVADEVAFALEASDPPPGLADGEERLLAACEGVNELATARRDERRLTLRHSLSAARTVPRCEQTTRAVAESLASARAQ
jgi:hypothetical protein